GGDPKIRDIEHRAHGEAMREQLGLTIEEVERLREEEALGGDELRALGSVVVLEASDAAFPLKLESLDRITPGGKTKAPRQKWLVLSGRRGAEGGKTKKAPVWFPDNFRQGLIEIFEKSREEKPKKGNPRTRPLAENTSRTRGGAPADLGRWGGPPPMTG